MGRAVFAAFDMLRRPSYAIPLCTLSPPARTILQRGWLMNYIVINLTGSVWFFLLIGKAGMILLSPLHRLEFLLTAVG